MTLPLTVVIIGSRDTIDEEDSRLITLLDFVLVVNTADMSDLRLVNGGSSAQGRVEMMFKGEWGVLCMDEFHLEEATVVCHQLGFIFAESVGSLYAEGTVTKKFILNCNGNEENIRQCYRSDGFCPTSANLGVTCSNGHPDFPLSSLHCSEYKNIFLWPSNFCLPFT